MTAKELEQEFQREMNQKLAKLMKGFDTHQKDELWLTATAKIKADEADRLAYFEKEAERMNEEERQQEERLKKYREQHGDLVGTMIYYEQTYGRKVTA